MRGFYFITDAGLSRRGIVADVKSALAAGVKVVQYRNKQASTAQLYAEAMVLRRLCRKVIFLVNDRADIALAAGADGVHLGQDDLPYQVSRRLLGTQRIIGVTVHNLREALAAQALGADYLGVSPIFATGTKHDAGRPRGIALLQQLRPRIKIPLIAIGGITLANAPAVIAAGADGVAAISAVLTAPDVRREVEKFQALFAR